MSAIAGAVRGAGMRPIALPLVFALACAAWAVWLGQSASWDLRNYHLYGAWAWLHDRFDRDVAPAQFQGYLNPALHLFTLWGAASLPPRAYAALLGFLQGLNAVPLWLLARRALPAYLGERRETWALVLALLGATGATQLGELGATQGDNLLTLPFLAGIALLVGGAGARSRAFGAALVGFAGGLKLTAAPFALGALLAVPLLEEARAARVRASVVPAVAWLAGFALAAGPWMLELWSRYGSPLFPLSSLGLAGVPTPSMDVQEARFLPRGSLDALLHPMTVILHPRRVSDEWFRDLRLPLLFLSLPVFLWLRARAGDGIEASSRVRAYLWLAVGIGYPFWVVLSGYYRYASPLEMLAPLLLGCTFLAYAPHRRAARVALACVLALVAVTTRPPRWGHEPFGARFLEVQAPEIPERAVVVLAGTEPLAFLALALGPEHDYVRVESNIQGLGHAPWWLDRRAADALDREPRAVYALFQRDAADVADAYARFGLAVDTASCGVVHANLVPAAEPPIHLCAATRVRPARKALDAASAPWLERCRALPEPERARLRECRAVLWSNEPNRHADRR